MSALISSEHRCLIAAAAPREARAALDAFGVDHADPSGITVLDDRFDLVETGVSKAAASAMVMLALTRKPYGSVVSAGICGSLPVENPPALLSSICATRSVMSDEGVGTGGGFIPLSEMGFGPFPGGDDGIDHDPGLASVLGTIADRSGTIATVSWCSGDDACAQGVVKRTGAIAEAMEGAACALGAVLFDPDIRTGELRVVSNTTGERASQRWDLDGALSALTDVLGRFSRAV